MGRAAPSEWWPRARARLRAGAWPAAQAAGATGLAWYLAADVVGHGQPFFAPISAAVSLSASRGARGTRAVQMMLGVVLGILVADGIVALLGTAAAVVALVTFVAMALALVATDGVMFVNQAAASAILVIALNRHGTAANRLIDALIGGGCALLFSQVLFPLDPVRLLRDAVRDVVHACADAVAGTVDALRGERPVDADWTLQLTREVHEALARFANAQRTSERVTWMSRRRRLRGRIADASSRVLRLDLLANAVLSLVRSTARIAEDPGHGPEPWLAPALADLCEALRAHTRGPAERDRVRDLAERVRRTAAAHRGSPDPAHAVVALHLGDVAEDLLAVLGGRRRVDVRDGASARGRALLSRASRAPATAPRPR